jgi:hypothetical protein
VSVRHTPPDRGNIDVAYAVDPPEDWQRKLRLLTATIDALATIQQYTHADPCPGP